MVGICAEISVRKSQGFHLIRQQLWWRNFICACIWVASLTSNTHTHTTTTITTLYVHTSLALHVLLLIVTKCTENTHTLTRTGKSWIINNAPTHSNEPSQCFATYMRVHATKKMEKITPTRRKHQQNKIQTTD